MTLKMHDSEIDCHHLFCSFLKKHKTTVHRRYKDFEALFDLLLARFPYRMVPKLPPKKAVGGMRLCVDFLFKKVDEGP